ncbi:MAG: fibronectin type III domain-containing protein, partial [Nitrosomonas sp.]
FRSQTGNPNDVSIGLLWGSGINLKIFEINGASNLIIRDLTFGPNVPQGLAIYFNNSCSNVKIINNIFSESISKFVGTDIGEEFASTTNVNDIQIKDNIFDSEFNNVVLGNNFNISSNITITSNTFPGTSLWFGKSAITIYNCNSLTIDNNYVDGEVNLYSCSYFKISKNKFLQNFLYGGLTMRNCGSIYTQSIISNNFCWTGNQYYHYFNFRTESSLNLLFINNTLSSAPYLFGSEFYLESSTDISLINNIFNTNGRALNIDNNSTLTISDHNDVYNGGNAGLIKYHGITYDNVSDFYTATGFDQHSVSNPVNFLSSSDLHLDGTSIGDNQLKGVFHTLVSDDIDNEIRMSPYMGADEADFPLPVELSSLTSSVNNSNVSLNWTTSSETNNSGFDIERRDERSETQDVWKKITFINGHGSTTTPNNYSFTDRNLSSGKYKYRLKQIDFNGNFEYHNLLNEVLIGVPDKFSLSQNYPNPFNPTTRISYELPITNFVSLKVYDVLGNEVGSLVNQKQNAGSFEISFDGSNL